MNYDIVVLDVGEAGEDEGRAVDPGADGGVGAAGETAVLLLDAVHPLEGRFQQPRIHVALQFDGVEHLDRHRRQSMS